MTARTKSEMVGKRGQTCIGVAALAAAALVAVPAAATASAGGAAPSLTWQGFGRVVLGQPLAIAAERLGVKVKKSVLGCSWRTISKSYGSGASGVTMFASTQAGPEGKVNWVSGGPTETNGDVAVKGPNGVALGMPLERAEKNAGSGLRSYYNQGSGYHFYSFTGPGGHVTVFSTLTLQQTPASKVAMLDVAVNAQVGRFLQMNEGGC